MSVEIEWPYIVHNVRSAPIKTHQARQWAFYHDIDEIKLIQSATIHPQKDTWFSDRPTAQCQCDYCKTEREIIGD